jgi:nucleotide-binding universal stress UspA family protein
MHPTWKDVGGLRMTGFDRVLIPLDGSQRAEAALSWVRVLDAQGIRLLRVCPEGNDDESAVAHEYLAAAAARSCPPGATVDIRVVVGDPAERIVAEAAETDLIVMSTQGAGDGGRRLFGSVADRVSRHAPVPTLLLRGGRAAVPTAPLQRIVVPLDGSAAAERALPIGAKLAGMLGAPVHLISVHEIAPGERSDLTDQRQAAHDARLDDIRAYLDREAAAVRVGDVSAATEIRTGTPDAELLEAVGPGDLLVITTHGRGTARRWQIGRVAEKLLRHAAAPIVMIRADGD